jgi:hypothetical protein
VKNDPTEEESLADRAEKALKEAVRKVVEEARRRGTPLVVWKDGKVAHIAADEVGIDRVSSE